MPYARAQEYSDIYSAQGEIDVAKQQRKERSSLKASFDGQVYDVKVTRGPVQQGEELPSILPNGEEIVMSVKVANQDVGFVKSGMMAKVKPTVISRRWYCSQKVSLLRTITSSS